VTVTNTGATTKLFYADARLRERALLQLVALTPTQIRLPQLFGDPVPTFLVPTKSRRVVFAARSTVPIAMDLSTSTYYPAAAIRASDGTAVAMVDQPQLAPGPWSPEISEIGPFGPAGAPSAVAEVGAAVDTNAFDTTVASDTGNVQLAAIDADTSFAPLVLRPGESGTISLTITPTGPRQGVVRGSVTIASFNPDTLSGDDIADLPYAYSIA